MSLLVLFGALILLGGTLNAIGAHFNGREARATIYAAIALFGVGLVSFPLLKKSAGSPISTAEASVAPAPQHVAVVVDPRGTPERQAELLNEGMNAVRSNLKDPWSAQFQNLYINLIHNNVPVTCGLVNAKGGFGGYTGWKRFASIKYTAMIDTGAWQFENHWRDYCESRR